MTTPGARKVPRVMLVLDLQHVALGFAAAGRAEVVVQVRDRDATARALVAATRALVARGVLVVVNDRVDLAVAAGAAGVHLPEAGLPVADARAQLGADAWIGVSVHAGSPLEARTAGADWAVFGPVWPTPGKGEGVGPAALADAARRCRCPVLAVGGVSLERVTPALMSGAHGVAVIRAATQLDALVRAAGAVSP